jgi:hypothetical protein
MEVVSGCRLKDYSDRTSFIKRGWGELPASTHPVQVIAPFRGKQILRIPRFAGLAFGILSAYQMARLDCGEL